MLRAFSFVGLMVSSITRDWNLKAWLTKKRISIAELCIALVIFDVIVIAYYYVVYGAI